MLELEYQSQGVSDREFQLAVRNRVLEVVLGRIEQEVLTSNQRVAEVLLDSDVAVKLLLGLSKEVSSSRYRETADNGLAGSTRLRQRFTRTQSRHQQENRSWDRLV